MLLHQGRPPDTAADLTDKGGVGKKGWGVGVRRGQEGSGGAASHLQPLRQDRTADPNCSSQAVGLPAPEAPVAPAAPAAAGRTHCLSPGPSRCGRWPAGARTPVPPCPAGPAPGTPAPYCRTGVCRRRTGSRHRGSAGRRRGAGSRVRPRPHPIPAYPRCSPEAGPQGSPFGAYHAHHPNLGKEPASGFGFPREATLWGSPGSCPCFQGTRYTIMELGF